MASSNTDKTFLHKVVMYILGGISSILGYIAVEQRNRVLDLKEVVTQHETKYKLEREDKLKVQREKDSLQGLILSRTDKSVSFEQLEKLINIRNNKSTITITPKKR